MKLKMHEHYIYENDLVKLVGVRGIDNLKTCKCLIEWNDSDGQRLANVVKSSELREAPSMPLLYQQYQDALEVICKQANIIEEMEEKLRDLEARK